MNFLYKATEQYYGKEGQESIDPVVYFKICLGNYINNIGSDRKLIEYCSNCLDVRLFIKYDIDEPLPWYSTISRARQLYGEEVFLGLFRKVPAMCVHKGMVRARCQAIDSAFVKANASLDSLLEKEVYDDAEALRYCKNNRIDAYIPNFGQYKPTREGFIYNKEPDQYECQRGNRAILPFKKIARGHDNYEIKGIPQQQ